MHAAINSGKCSRNLPKWLHFMLFLRKTKRKNEVLCTNCLIPMSSFKDADARHQQEPFPLACYCGKPRGNDAELPCGHIAHKAAFRRYLYAEFAAFASRTSRDLRQFTPICRLFSPNLTPSIRRISQLSGLLIA